MHPQIILRAILERLDVVNDESFEVSMPRQIAAQAATAIIPSYVNGAI